MPLSCTPLLLGAYPPILNAQLHHSILILQLRHGVVRPLIQFMIVGTQLAYKLQPYMKFQFGNYNDGGMEAFQKIQNHLPIKLLQKSRKVQLVSILTG